MFGTTSKKGSGDRGFIQCPECSGMGFLRRGKITDNNFQKCKKCEGLGTIDPPPPPPPPVDFGY